MSTTSYQPPISPDDDHEEYTVVPVIAVDYHTDEHPECFGPDCECHQQRITDLTQDYQDGLASADDATRIVRGKTV